MCGYSAEGLKQKPQNGVSVMKRKNALQAYEREMKTVHENVEMKSTGLIIRSDLPQFGASSDAIIKDACCGDGCVEIKCPFLLKKMSIQ